MVLALAGDSTTTTFMKIRSVVARDGIMMLLVATGLAGTWVTHTRLSNRYRACAPELRMEFRSVSAAYGQIRAAAGNQLDGAVETEPLRWRSRRPASSSSSSTVRTTAGGASASRTRSSTETGVGPSRPATRARAPAPV